MNKDRKIIDIARQVIDDEVEALIGLKDCIDESFEEIIDVICECKGRIIFTGIGKSGHISKKISATLTADLLKTSSRPRYLDDFLKSLFMYL